MAEWKKIKTVLYDNGERDITYEAPGLHTWVQSRRRHIPHANGTGYWDSTLYVLIDPETGEQFPGLRREVLRSEGCELPARYQEKQPKEPLQEDTFQDYAEIGKDEEPRDIMRLANLAYERMIEAQRTACRLCNLLSGDDFTPTKTGEPENLRDMLAENLTAAAYVAELLEQARQALEGNNG